VDAKQPHAHLLILRWAAFLSIAIVGLLYVKWLPYYSRAFIAAAEHSIGQSILMGTDAAPPPPSLAAAFGYALAYGKAIWQAMLLGLLLGSAIQALVPADWVTRMLGKTSFASVAMAGALALPGMMCTCCAAPVVVGLRARQASPGAAIAFWLGNTILNPATLVFMGFVLGWDWAAFRIVLGVLMVFGLGQIVNLLATSQEAEAAGLRMSQMDACGDTPLDIPGILKRWWDIFVRLSVRLIPEYVVLLLLLGAARAWLFPEIGPQIGNELYWIAVFAFVGMLFVIPTAGEIPIVQAMLALGMGVGPAAALLMTLPPISVPSLAMVAGSFRWQTLAVVSAGVVGFGILAGVLAVSLGL